ncbi:MAG: S9 family peptidase [Acidobacteria bacterium]|nr:S9 family peptidase [Acidobacteriota bacterium]
MRTRPGLVLAFGLVCLLWIADTANGQRALTFKDMISLGRVSDPQMSLDGHWVAYVVDRYHLDTNGRSSSLWLASLPSGESRELTRPPQGKRDRSPRWSPDSKTLAFLSNRSGSWQVWSISLEGGEAWQRTDLPVDLDGLLWSPDGAWWAVTAEVYPDCDNLECTKKRDEEKEKSRVQARLYDRLMVRHWNQWSEGKRSHVFVIPVAGGPARDLTPGDWSVPPFLGGPHEYDFSPDGRRLAFARNLDKDEALSTNSDLWVVAVTGGPSTALGTSEAQRITDNPAWDGSPQYSPDGRWIAYRAMARAGFEADRTRLILYERATGKITELTPKFPDSVDDFVWAPDSASFYFTASVGAASPIYRVSLADRSVRAVVANTNNSNLRLSADGGTLVFTRQTMNRPAEVFAADSQSGEARQLSHVNDKLIAELTLNPGESFTVKGAGGTPVQSWLLKPPGFDPAQKYPVVVLIHGGPQGTFSDEFHYRWNAQLFAAPGYVVVLPNPRGSPGWGQLFVDEISGDWGGKVYEDIMKVVDQVETLPFVDKTRICAGGGSYGGYMADWILGHTDRFRCLISHAGVYNLTSEYGATEELWFPEWEFRGTPWTNREMYERWSPHNFVPRFKTPTLVIHGALDYRVPYTQGLELFTALQRQGIRSRLLYFPDEGHWILKPKNAELWYQTVHEWLATYLK